MSTANYAERLARLTPAQKQRLERLLEQRRRTREAGAERDRPATATEEALARIWGELLGVDDPGLHDNFYELGGDSIIGMQIAARATAEGIPVSPQQVLEAQTVAGLAELSRGAADAAPQDGETEGEAVGEVLLTPIQQWFFEQDIPDSHHWDQTLHIALRQPVRAALLRRALARVAAHHDVLRSRFQRTATGWRHWVDAHAPDPVLSRVDLTGLPGPQRAERVRRAVADAQRDIDLGRGPLLTAVLCEGGARPGDTGANGDFLVLIAHHLVVDGISLRVLTDDLDQVYRRLERGEDPRPPARTTSFRKWSRLLREWAADERITGQLPYWTGVPDARATEVPLTGPGAAHEGGAEPSNTVGRSAVVTTRLDRELTATLLRQVPARGTQPHHLLLAALLSAWPRTPGTEGLQLDLEAHGREVVAGTANVSRTVGWFTAIHPVRFPLPAPDRPGDAVDAVTRTLAEVPDNGLGYGLLRYLGGPGGAALARLPQSRVSFNYLGRFERGSGAGTGEILGNPVQAPGVLQSADAPRRYLLDIVVTAMDRELTAEFVFARDLLPEDEVRRLADHWEKRLRELVGLLTGAAGGLDDRQLSAVRRRMGLGPTA
ncbi:condensation domain-containing protein [Streptomyces sp. NPDC001985]|uniref:condensation domain-containing protein n=1 Tax=Streptomyces sp. NPDC001985 TaxID=3154406 RepID=UPI0033341A09